MTAQAPKDGAAAATAREEVKYRPEVFAVDSIEDAKKIILTPEPGTTTDERWEKETPHLVDQMVSIFSPNARSVVLDYGCGIGRLAKGLIERTGCTVIGVDISPHMRVLANTYVDSDRLVTTSPNGLVAMLRAGLKVDHAYSVWVLQHCISPDADIAVIHGAVRPNGCLFVVNSAGRCVPTNIGWASDGIDMATLLLQRFEAFEDRPWPEGVTTEELSRDGFCRVYRPRTAVASSI